MLFGSLQLSSHIMLIESLQLPSPIMLVESLQLLSPIALFKFLQLSSHESLSAFVMRHVGWVCCVSSSFLNRIKVAEAATAYAATMVRVK